MPSKPSVHLDLHQLRSDAILAASRLDDASVHAAIDILQQPSMPPDAVAAAIRLRWMLGDAMGAGRALEQALQTDVPGPDLAALATLALPDGDRWGRARLATGTPGQRADAACDLAWRALRDADVPGARDWVDAALAHCPEHAEALHWRRVLAEHGDDTATVLDRGLRDPLAPGWADAIDLVPSPPLGWFSQSRLRRRIICPPPSLAAPEAQALAWLQDRGVCTRAMATDADYTTLSPDHGLVACEQALDLALCLEAEGRPARPAAVRAWALAHTVDHEAAKDAANVLVAMGCRREDVRAVALEAADLLHADNPTEPLWAAYRIHLLALRGQGRQVVASVEDLGPVERLDALSLSLVVESLRLVRAGHRRIRGLLRRAQRQPHLQAMARDLRRKAPVDLTIHVSDRLHSRFSTECAEAVAADA